MSNDILSNVPLFVHISMFNILPFATITFAYIMYASKLYKKNTSDFVRLVIYVIIIHLLKYGQLEIISVVIMIDGLYVIVNNLLRG